MEEQTQTKLASKIGKAKYSSIEAKQDNSDSCGKSKTTADELAAKLLLNECKLGFCTGSSISRVEVV